MDYKLIEEVTTKLERQNKKITAMQDRHKIESDIKHSELESLQDELFRLTQLPTEDTKPIYIEE